MYKAKWSNKRLILAVVIVGIIGIIWGSGFHKYLTFDQIKRNALWLKDQVEHHYWWTVLVYMATFITVILCGLPAAALMNILGGFLFGVVQGVLYIIVAATLGGTLFFLMVRYLIGSYLQTRFAHQLHTFNQSWEKRGWQFLILLRCIPLIPFFMVNALAGLTSIDVRTFIWTTALGVIPTALIFTFAGKQLGKIECMRDIFTVPVIAALALLGILGSAPWLISRTRKIF